MSVRKAAAFIKSTCLVAEAMWPGMNMWPGYAKFLLGETEVLKFQSDFILAG